MIILGVNGNLFTRVFSRNKILYRCSKHNLITEYSLYSASPSYKFPDELHSIPLISMQLKIKRNIHQHAIIITPEAFPKTIPLVNPLIFSTLPLITVNMPRLIAKM